MKTTGSLGQRLLDAWRRFRHDNRGGTLIIIAASAVPLVAFVGLAIDGGRGYFVKSRLSHALDSAALAGARAALTDHWLEDVETFFATNFPDQYMGTKIASKDFQLVEDGDKIVLTASITIPTTFMGVLGFKEMTVSATTEVKRENSGLELVLAMDVTGSMRSGGKIEASRQAAADLIQILYGDQDSLEHVWVSFVPYATTMNIGPDRQEWLDGTVDVDSVYDPTIWQGCVEARTGADMNYPGMTLDQTDSPPNDGLWTAFFYAPHWHLPVPDGESPKGDNMWWPGDDSTVDETNDMSISGGEGDAKTGPNLGCPQQPITPLTQDRDVIDAEIQAMLPWHRGGTLGNLGLAWAWRVISPDWQDAWTEYAGTGLPKAYDEPLLNKVVVIMTDGRNQYYRWPGSQDYVGDYPFQSDYGGYKRLDADLLDDADTMNEARDEVDARMAETCTLMKEKEIVIYALTFGSGVDQQSKDLFSACATSPSHYIHAASNNVLTTAFKNIGHELNNLRLSR